MMAQEIWLVDLKLLLGSAGVGFFSYTILPTSIQGRGNEEIEEKQKNPIHMNRFLFKNKKETPQFPMTAV